MINVWMDMCLANAERFQAQAQKQANQSRDATSSMFFQACADWGAEVVSATFLVGKTMSNLAPK